MAIHGISAVEEMEQCGIGFRSLAEGIDPSTNGGRLVFHIFAALSKFEKGDVCERTSAGREAVDARRGLVNARRP